MTINESKQCDNASKQAVMSPSSTHSYVLDARKRVSAMASCARRLGRKPYEHGSKSASKIGSSTSFSDACTTRSATVGTDVPYCSSCNRVSGSSGRGVGLCWPG